jgi:hypothetical protein
MWHCWVCDNKGTNLYTLFNKIKVSKYHKDKLIKILKDKPKHENVKTEKDYVTLALPMEFKPLWIENKKNFFWNTNFTITESKINMSASELQSRKLTAREGEVIKNTRDMAGQAPFLINTGLAYQGQNNGLEAGVFYNVQGATLNYVGFGNRTDTYSVPFHSVNLNVNKSFGTEERMQAGFGIDNLLNDKREFIFESYNAQDQIFSSLAPGVRVKFSFSYSF